MIESLENVITLCRVAIYIRSNLSYNILHSISIDYKSEFLIIQVNLLNEKFLFCVIYRPPKSPHPHDFFNAISNFLPTFKHVITIGDLNSNMVFPNNYLKLEVRFRINWTLLKIEILQKF